METLGRRKSMGTNSENWWQQILRGKEEKGKEVEASFGNFEARSWANKNYGEKTSSIQGVRMISYEGKGGEKNKILKASLFIALQ